MTGREAPSLQRWAHSLSCGAPDKVFSAQTLEGVALHLSRSPGPPQMDKGICDARLLTAHPDGSPLPPPQPELVHGAHLSVFLTSNVTWGWQWLKDPGPRGSSAPAKIETVEKRNRTVASAGAACGRLEDGGAQRKATAGPGPEGGEHGGRDRPRGTEQGPGDNGEALPRRP